MTREYKILDFMSTTWGGRRWCTADVCACMGCVNGSIRSDWKNKHPDEPPITKDEFNEVNSKLPKEEQKGFSMSYFSVNKAAFVTKGSVLDKILDETDNGLQEHIAQQLSNKLEATMKDIITTELTQAHSVLSEFMRDYRAMIAIEDAANIMIDCIKNGGKIIACGNGGSMSDAMHFCSELTGRYRKDRPPIPAIAISDPGHMSCVANDFGYEQVFSRFIGAHGKPGDVLLALSTSGKSLNVNFAVFDAVKLRQMKIVLITGSGVIFNKSEPITHIEIPHSGTADRTQEITILVIHILVNLIEKGLGYA